MQYYNVHSHLFTMNNAPKKFLHLYLPGVVAEAVDKITETQAGSYAIQKLLMLLGGNGGKRYASFLKIGKSKDQRDVFLDLMKQYNDDTTFKFVGLTMDMEECGAGPSLSGYEGQLEEILSIKKQFPDNLLLFLGIDPRWKLSGSELKDTVETYFENKLAINSSRSVYPFVGIKIYPSMGYYPFDQRLKETFAWAAKRKVPVLSHCNYLGGIFNNNNTYIQGVINGKDPYNNDALYPAGGVSYTTQKRFGRWIMGRQKATNNLNRCSYFMEPYAFTTMLTEFKNKDTPLKLCLAHFGGGNQLKTSIGKGNQSKEDTKPYGVLNTNWFSQVQQMMKTFDTLYTDISYALHDTEIHPALISEIKDASYGNRIMFGTDFFLTEREGPEVDTYRIFRDAATKIDLGQGITAWDRVAHSSTENFLASDFYNGSVI